MRWNGGILRRILILAALVALLGVATRPQAIDLELEAARRAIENNNPAEASVNFAAAAEVAPWRDDLWLLAARYALQAGDPQAAVRYLQRSPTPDNLLLGDACQQAGALPCATTAWQSALDAGAPPLDILPRLLTAHRAQRNYPAALADLQALWNAQPASAQTNYQLGLLLATAKPAAAQPYLTRAAELDASLQPAVETLQHAIETKLDPDEPAYTLLAVGRALGTLNEWELAAEALRQSTALRPDYAEAWAYLAEARQHLNEDGSAELGQALLLAPNSVAVNALAGLYWQRKGDYGQSLAYINVAAQNDPRNPVWQAEIARTLAQNGDLPAAQIAYNQAIALAPGNPTYWRLLAEFSLTYQIQVHEIALPAARQAVLLDEDDPANLTTMAQALLQLGDLLTAERYLRRAIILAPNDPAIHLYLGQMYLLRAEPALARQEFALVQSLAPATPLADQAKRLMERYFP